MDFHPQTVLLLLLALVTGQLAVVLHVIRRANRRDTLPLPRNGLRLVRTDRG